MFNRFWIICSVIAIGLAVLSVLGLSSLGMHEKGLRAERQQEFIAVARQISFDVKRKVDAFLQAEQARPYTDYQYYYVPQASNQAAALVRSPLGSSLSNDLAYGYFQLDNAGEIATPYATSPVRAPRAVRTYLDNLKDNLLPSLENGETLQVHRIEPVQPQRQVRYGERDKLGLENFSRLTGRDARSDRSLAADEEPKKAEAQTVLKDTPPEKPGQFAKQMTKGAPSRRARYPITLDEAQQQTQVMTQQRGNYEMNTMLQQEAESAPAEALTQTAVPSDELQGRQAVSGQPQEGMLDYQTQEELPDRVDTDSVQSSRQQRQTAGGFGGVSGLGFESVDRDGFSGKPAQDDLVQVRIEPFVPMTVPEPDGKETVFAGQVFLLRHVQIEDQHFLQGFRLDESQLLEQITESARQFIRRGMGFEIAKTEQPDAAYTAVLDFGFGDLMLNLLEEQPGWILARVNQIRNWFFAILTVVWLAVVIALAAFWRNLHEQVQLSRKKDDFISAVSHELRTPLTSIRMYTEMLEKDWVKTDQKRREYYATMRQESERLTRLIENVLDFSRIQRGKKQYHFALGDINRCVEDVVRMMRPCTERAGFAIIWDPGDVGPFMFDRDAVAQIVINLLDNALKYANGTPDKRILIRTRKQKQHVIVEVEDHGPGIPRSQQKKIFEAFYRCGDESTRQATGTGLGLALVKRFAEAHRGFVEITTAKPAGTCFRVALANQPQS